MGVRVFVLSVSVLLSAVNGQWVEDTIEVGASPTSLCYNDSMDRLYCGTSAESLGLLVINGATNAVTDTVPYPLPAAGLCCNPIENVVYWISNARFFGVIIVVDCSTNAVLDTVGTTAGNYLPLCLNSTSNKLYATVTSMGIYGIRIYNCTTQELLGYESGIALGHNPADNKLYANYHSLRIIDGVGDTLLDTLPSVRYGLSACHNPLRGKVYVGLDSFVCVVDGAGDSLLGTILVPRWNLHMCHGSIDDKLYSVGEGTLVTVIDCSQDTVLTTIDVGRPVSGLLYDSSYNNVYCISKDSNDVTVIDCSEDTVLVTIGVGQAPSAFCCNPQNDRIYIANAGDSTVSVICTGPVGVEEEVVTGPAPRQGPFARGVLNLDGQASGELLDVSGRRVMELHPGENDIRHVAPGVYFVRQKQSDRTTKVVVQR